VDWEVEYEEIQSYLSDSIKRKNAQGCSRRVVTTVKNIFARKE